MAKDEYIHCPQCGSVKIEQTDYEGENGDEDMDGRHCLCCHWEGDVSQLVAAE